MPIVAEQYTFVIEADTPAVTNSLALVTAATGAPIDQSVFPKHGNANAANAQRVVPLQRLGALFSTCFGLTGAQGARSGLRILFRPIAASQVPPRLPALRM